MLTYLSRLSIAAFSIITITVCTSCGPTVGATSQSDKQTALISEQDANGSKHSAASQSKQQVASGKSVSCADHFAVQSTYYALKMKISKAFSTNKKSAKVDVEGFFADNTVLLNKGGLRPNYEDLVVYVSGPSLCGSGGCNALILRDMGASATTSNQYELMTAISPARLPITLLKTAHNGWQDIGMFVAGGGVIQAYSSALQYNGDAYTGNPTLSGLQKVDPSDVSKILIGPSGLNSDQCRLS